uniref:Transposase n=1 Tax=Ascaris lumbricoides TaxID=6252 RepID=A0A0M3HLG0_ASCLU
MRGYFRCLTVQQQQALYEYRWNHRRDCSRRFHL